MSEKEPHITPEALVIEYFTGTLSPAEQDTLLHLVQTDADVAELFKQYSVLKQSAPKPVVDYAPAYQEFLNNTKPKGKSKTLYFVGIVLAVAAMLTIILKPLVFDSSATKQIEIAIADSVQFITLPEQSSIALNENTELSYEQLFAENRTVQMRKGEAHFEIAKDSLHPFTVHTPDAIITVLGTGFNIKIDSTTNQTTVTVLHGKVSVQATQGNSVEILTKQEKITIKHGQSQFEKIERMHANELSWETKSLQFQASPIPTVIAALNNHFGCNLQLEDSNLDSCKLNANFDKPNLREILEMLTIAFDIHLEEKDNKQIILGPGC